MERIEVVLIFVGIVVLMESDFIDVDWSSFQVVSKNPYTEGVVKNKFQSWTGRVLEKGTFLDMIV